MRVKASLFLLNKNIDILILFIHLGEIRLKGYVSLLILPAHKNTFTNSSNLQMHLNVSLIKVKIKM